MKFIIPSMNQLRQRLLRQCPTLHLALEKSWEIAREKWLPAIKPSEGSYNSGPHFRNIEYHLDALLLRSNSETSEQNLIIDLSSLELYLLLASVLFHDIGRLKGNLNHAYASQDILQARFTDLGIPSLELAYSLARIAVYHDPIKKNDQQFDVAKPASIRNRTVNASNRVSADEYCRLAREELRDVIVEPYGRARELNVATLLALADHLDGSVMRTEPDFVHADDEISFKGAFRRIVAGSAYDRATKCIKTCIQVPYGGENVSFAKSELNSFVVSQTNQQPLKPHVTDPSKLSCPLYEEVFGSQPRRLFSDVLSGKYFLERKNGVSARFPADYVLAIVLLDLKQNSKFLKKVANDLRGIGMPIESWLIEYKCRTYNEQGIPTPVPVFTSRFLEAVAESMKELSCLAFANKSFSYQMLADSLRDPNVELVRQAVQYIQKNPRESLLRNLQILAFPDSWSLRRSTQSND